MKVLEVYILFFVCYYERKGSYVRIKLGYRSFEAIVAEVANKFCQKFFGL